jgi:hypothetical protein
MSCTDLHGFFTNGECGTKADVRAQVASLYYAFAVDVVSDFMSKSSSSFDGAL